MDRERKLRMLRDELDDLPEAVYDEMVASLHKSATAKLGEIEAALGTGNHDVGVRLAHSIHGTAGNLRLTSVREGAANLEEVLRAGADGARIRAAFAGLDRAVKDLVESTDGDRR